MTPVAVVMCVYALVGILCAIHNEWKLRVAVGAHRRNRDSVGFQIFQGIVTTIVWPMYVWTILIAGWEP